MNYHLFELINQRAGRADGVDDVMELAATTAASAIALAVALFLHRGWGMALAVLAVMIGLSRVWVAVHYPGDILAAAAIAGLAALEVKLCSIWTPWPVPVASIGSDALRSLHVRPAP